MSQAFLIFGATFLSVFTLGLQSLNVNQGHYVAAAVTSFFIGTGHILLYKYMPGADLAELLGYWAGGIAGITSSIWFHKRAKAWLSFRIARWKARRAAGRRPDEHRDVANAGGVIATHQPSKETK